VVEGVVITLFPIDMFHIDSFRAKMLKDVTKFMADSVKQIKLLEDDVKKEGQF